MLLYRQCIIPQLGMLLCCSMMHFVGEINHLFSSPGGGMYGVTHVGSRTAANNPEHNTEEEAEEAMETGQFDDADD